MLCAALLGGCATPSPPSPGEETDPSPSGDAAIAPLLERAERLYAEERYQEALRVVLEASRRDPDSPALTRLRNRVLSAMLDERTLRSSTGEDLNRRKAVEDARRGSRIPDSFFVRKPLPETGETPHGGESPMMELLRRPATLHLADASLSTLIRALSEDPDINMIADPSLGSASTVDIQATDVPLREILDYMSNHFEVQFHTGRHSIWVTSRDPGRAPPMETRVYRLRRGHQLHGLSWGAMAEEERKTESDISALTRKATVLPQEASYFKNMVEKFVPSENGAQFHVDLNSNTLFARNTPENLAMVETIVNALDTTPPQVLIEARFIEISQSDLREIGIDWILGSPLILSDKGVLENGQRVDRPRTVIDEGGSVTYEPFRSDNAGSFPLGPQGPFGQVREGNPPTDDQGLNLTYSGLLTEPMFNAVLHALEISGKGKTLSVPRVTTLNNYPAKLRDGNDLHYYEEFQAQAFSLVDADNKKYTVTALIPKGKPRTAELGFTLVAVPSVGADNRTISLLLTPTISELLEFISYQEEIPQTPGDEGSRQIQQVVVKLPRIARREVQTKVVVESGETVVMGGLIRTVSQETVHKVPFLGSIPLMGELFKRTDITREERNLIIFVTATVISQRGESLVPVISDPEG